uniref:DNA-directed RNA polymerase subunit alpha n=1 Tax=Erythrotrichia carnea TaxID=35151 RepID=A0A1C9CEK6_9RHOD|nr:DNA-directed RNA polymerase alpha subunit [Erythrotrichia carnea]AOM66838.1 DNA-directed RNA polymerase alpha subunit [Erythrotrichia carnea]
MTQFQIECIESKSKGPREQYGQFIIEPLKQGQGLTIGNALRRTILGELEGTIVAVRIAGVNHEFSTIEGVKEDVLEILLNLKEVVLKSDINNIQVGRVRIQGPVILTAGMFEVPSEISIIDPRQYIATICNNILFEMEFQIEKSYGYRLMEKGFDHTGIDFLRVDAVFMPAKKVNYIVRESKLAYADGMQDSLTVEIWTNGSISPQEAITNSANILTNLFSPLKHLNLKVTTNEDPQEEKKISQVLIEELHLSVRAYNCLKRAQIHSVADLLDYSQEELLEIKNFGQKSADEVIEALQKRLGISLPKEKASKNS